MYVVIMEEWKKIKNEYFNSFVFIHPCHRDHLKHFETLLSTWSTLKISKIDYKYNMAGRWSLSDEGVLTLFGSPFEIILRDKKGNCRVQNSNIWVVPLLNRLVKFNKQYYISD